MTNRHTCLYHALSINKLSKDVSKICFWMLPVISYKYIFFGRGGRGTSDLREGIPLSHPTGPLLCNFCLVRTLIYITVF